VQDFVQQVYAFNQRLLARSARKVQAFQRGVRQAGYYVFQLTQAAVPVETGYHPQGQAKFVEGPMRQARGTVNTIIVASVRAAA
jgi:N-acetylmuramoyl-L-alanine amidase